MNGDEKLPAIVRGAVEQVLECFNLTLASAVVTEEEP